jgi:DNA-binding NarL/FixJ family response regulator
VLAEGRADQAIRERLFLNPTTVEAYGHVVLATLDLQQAADGHRRVLAVLAHLRARSVRERRRPPWDRRTARW